MLNTYELYFTLKAPANVLIKVEKGESILDAFNQLTNAELLTKIKDAIDLAGYKITNIEKINK